MHKIIFREKSPKNRRKFVKHTNTIRLKVAIRYRCHKWALLTHMDRYMETRDHELFEGQPQIDIQLLMLWSLTQSLREMSKPRGPVLPDAPGRVMRPRVDHPLAMTSSWFRLGPT